MATYSVRKYLLGTFNRIRGNKYSLVFFCVRNVLFLTKKINRFTTRDTAELVHAECGGHPYTTPTITVRLKTILSRTYTNRHYKSSYTNEFIYSRGAYLFVYLDERRDLTTSTLIRNFFFFFLVDN